MQDQVLLNNCVGLDSIPAANIPISQPCVNCVHLFTPIKMPVT